MRKSDVSQNKTVIINTISIVLIQGINFFTIPVFSRILGTGQYGIYSTFIAWLQVFSAIFGCSVGDGLATGRYKFEKEYSAFRSSILLLGTVLAGLLGCGLLIGNSIIQRITGFDIKIILMLLLTATATFVITFSNSAFIFEKRPQANLYISAVLTISTVLLQFLFLGYNSDIVNSASMMIYGYCIPYVITAILVWIVLFKEKPTLIRKPYAVFALQMGIPTVFHLLSNTILTQSDRVMMYGMGISNNEIGIYSLYYNLSMVLCILLSALNKSWVPYFYDDLKNESYYQLKIKCRNYIELFTIITMGFLLLSREVGYLMGDKSFWSGIEVIPILTISTFFTFLYQFPVNFEFFYRKNAMIAIGTIFAAGCNVVLNIVFIPKWGMYGAAIATMMSYFVLFLIHTFFVKVIMKQTLLIAMKDLMISIVCIMVAIGMFYFLHKYWYIRWGVGVLIGIFELKKILDRKSIF